MDKYFLNLQYKKFEDEISELLNIKTNENNEIIMDMIEGLNDANIRIKKILNNEKIEFNTFAYCLCDAAGIGDNITMTGAVNYLSLFYDKIYLLVWNRNIKNCKLLHNNERINYINNYEFIFNNCFDKNNNSIVDIFTGGHEIKRFGSTCTQHKYLKHKKHKKIFTYIKIDQHILDFYINMGLDPNFLVDYFMLSYNDDIYNKIKDIPYIFVHMKSSEKEIDIDISKYIDDYLIICPDKCIYNEQHKYFKIATDLAEKEIYYYIPIIKNARKIFVVDSCFCCITYPLYLRKELNTDQIFFYSRHTGKGYSLGK